MLYRNVCLKAVVIQVLVVIALLAGIVGGADAQGLGNELWGIDWAADAGQVTKLFQQQGFNISGQGKDSDGKWLKFEKGRFLDYSCDVKTKWAGKDLKEISIYLTDKGPKTAGIFQKLTEHCQQQYGSPSSTDSYYLKSFPPIKVEAAVWQVCGEGNTAFEIYLARMGTEEYAGEEPLDSRIDITIVKKRLQ